MINIAICDDNVAEVEVISGFVSKALKEVNIAFKISTFSDGEELIESIGYDNENYHIIFLDIYMKATNGIYTAKKIREYHKECKIIFITSSKEHAIDSYDVRATDYLLKPVNEDKLRNSINLSIEGLKEERNQILIKNKKGNYRVLLRNIIYAESEARIVNIHLKSKEVISFYSKLEDFYQNLNDERFIKCHKSFIINMDYIFKVEGKYIFMDNDIKIPISNSNIGGIKEEYFKYLLK